MRQALTTRNAGAYDAAVVAYTLAMGGLSAKQTTEAPVQLLVPGSCTVSDLRAWLNSASGSGKSWTLTVRKNGADTALAVTLSNTTTGANTSDSVSFVATDLISISVTPSGTPSVNAFTSQCLILNTANAGESFYMLNTGSSTFAASTQYLPAFGGNGGTVPTTEAGSEEVSSINGTLKDMYIQLGTAPGAGKSRTFVVRVNGADTALTCTISDTATTGNFTGGTVALAEGDLVDIKCSQTGTAATTANNMISLVVVSTDGNKFMIVDRQNSVESGTAVAYIPLTSAGANASSSTDAGAQQVVPAMTITKLFVNLSGAMGASTTRQYQLRVGTTDNANLNFTISDPAQSGSASYDVSISSGALLKTKCTPTGTPLTNGRSRHSYAAWIDTIASGTTYYKTIASTFSGAAALAKIPNYCRIIAGTLAGVAGIAQLRNLYRTIAAAVAGAGLIIKQSTFYKIIAGTLAGAGGVAKIKTAIRAVGASASLGATLSQVLELKRVIAATASLAGNIMTGASALYSKTIAATMTGAGSITKMLTWGRSVTVTAALSGTVAKVKTAYRTIAGSAALSGDISRVKSVFRSIQASVTGSGGVSRSLELKRSISATVSAVGNLAKMKTAVIRISATAVFTAGLKYLLNNELFVLAKAVLKSLYGKISTAAHYYGREKELSGMYGKTAKIADKYGAVYTLKAKNYNQSNKLSK